MSLKLNFSRLSLECVSTLHTLLPFTGLLRVKGDNPYKVWSTVPGT